MATAKKLSKAEQVRAYQVKHPNATASQVAKATGADIGYVYAIRHSDKGKAANLWQPPAMIPMPEPTTDNVNHPAHYKVGGIETIDFIEAKNLSYHLGNVVKYIARADSKGNREEDLLKARWYLNREIAKFAK